MSLQERYIVLKAKDIDNLTAEQKLQVAAVTDMLAESRKKRGRRPVCCVVVEDDWPEYKATRAALESRAHSERGISLGRKLMAMGYDLDGLERDSPYN